MKQARARVRKSRGFRIREVYEQLREMIVRGSLPPGMRLVESQLERQFRVSRTPIRSALRRLVAEGHVTSSGAGKEFLSVAPLSLDDAVESCEMVSHLERIAVRRVALLGFKPRSQLAVRLRECNRGLAAATRAAHPDVLHIFELDRLFHRIFTEAGSGPRLLAHLDTLGSQIERYERLYTSAYARGMGPTVREHARIAAAIRAGDPDAAEGAVQLNWTNSIRRLASVIGTAAGHSRWLVVRA